MARTCYFCFENPRWEEPIIEQLNLVLFLEGLWDEVILWVKNWWKKELDAETLEDIDNYRRDWMSPWHVPMQSSFLQKLKVKPGLNPKKWLEDSMCFLDRQGAPASPRLYIRQGEINSKDAVTKALLDDLPFSMACMLMSLTTSPPICSSPIQDVGLLLQLVQNQAVNRAAPRGLIQELEMRAMTSLLDIVPMLPSQSSDRVTHETPEDPSGPFIERETPERPGQYL